MAAVVELSDNVFTSLESYFKVLNSVGYFKSSGVNKLLVYAFIEELLTGPLRVFVSQDDYKTIQEALNCLYGTNCLIPYPEFANVDDLYGHIFSDGFLRNALMETKDLKVASPENLRFLAEDFPAKVLYSEMLTPAPSTEEPSSTDLPTVLPTDTSVPTDSPTEAANG